MSKSGFVKQGSECSVSSAGRSCHKEKSGFYLAVLCSFIKIHLVKMKGRQIKETEKDKLEICEEVLVNESIVRM